MRLILKIIFFPISLILSVLTSFLRFVLGIGSVLLNIIMVLCVFVALGSFFISHDTKMGIEALIFGFLFSPYGLPMIGDLVISFIEGINEWIRKV